MAGGNIPPQLAPIFQAASAQYKIPAAVLAGIASVESNMGSNQGPSSAGAVGLMQFEPGTARGLGINPMDPKQAIFGAAKLLNQYGFQQNPARAIGAYNGGPGNPQMGYAQQVLSEASRLKGQLGNPGAAPQMPGGNVGVPAQAGQQSNAATIAANYLKGSSKSPFDIGPSTGLGSGSSLLSPVLYKAAQNALQSLAGGQELQVHPGAITPYKGYVNPLQGFTLGRTDMGVDANARPGTPILALGDSKVLGISPNWYQGQPYMALKLLNGPHAGRVYYVAEQIDPLVKPGQVVHAGEPIARYAQQGTGIEVGWAGSNWQQTLAQQQGNTGDASHGNAPAGVDFRTFLTSL